ncbi:M56 family metallopeptidase [Psychroserpens sp. MEBiC05023]
MLIYILNFSACLAIFMLFYKLILEQSSIHQFKRFYLLSSVILALIIPSITLVEYIDPIMTNPLDLSTIPTLDTIESLPKETPLDFLLNILWSIYSIGALLFLIKFGFNLYRIISRIQNNPKQKSEHFINVLVENLKIPHTFFSFIFLNKKKFEHNTIPQEILLHEQTHAKQKHSIDILILEILQILFWFNPLVYLLKKDIKLNHEFLADQAVLNSGIQPATYQTMLLAYSSKAPDQQLANAINYSSIKKRFTIMKTQTPKQSVWVRTLFLLPLVAILFYSFTQREEVIKEDTPTPQQATYTSEGISDELMSEYNSFMMTYKSTNIVDGSKYDRIVSIYNMMSKLQQSTVEKYPETPNIDLSQIQGKVPSQKEFDSWKNNTEYAIWIDGEHVSNAKLNSLTPNDIAYYSGSFVHKNARSKTFPQSHQFKLYTIEGFKKTFQLSKVMKYHLLTKRYSDAIQEYLKGSQTDNSELKLQKEHIDRVYNSFTKKELKQHKILPAPPIPAQKKQKGATAKQVAEYNKLAKYYNDNLDRKHITIKMKDVERLKYLYGIMSKPQQKNAEPFPDFPNPPPPPPAPVSIEVVETKDVPPPPPISENATLKEKEKYKKAIKNYKTKAKAKVSKHKNEKGELIEIVEVVEVPPPPPPPPPRMPLDFIIDMAKVNANFYYEGKKVSSDKAIELIKSNKDLNIESKNSNEKQPDVYITKAPIIKETKTKQN